ncbi:MAG: MoxR family ATPase [bacterium]
MTFFLDPKREQATPDVLSDRPLPPPVGDHRAAASRYAASPELIDAINVALALGVPLLITGEPGTGKTQVAWYVAWYFGLDLHRQLFKYVVRSTSQAKELLYGFDDVAYFRDKDARPRATFVEKGPLWEAWEAGPATVVLIDEVDKAPRDFPNDLLDVLDQQEFRVPEMGADFVLRRPEGKPAPLMIITSNSERRLPGPFLRRCVFHHIELTEELVRQAVERQTFKRLDAAALDAAQRRFFELRGVRELRKKPTTSELLAWLAILDLRGGLDAEALRRMPLGALPALGTLIKDRDDLDRLR